MELFETKYVLHILSGVSNNDYRNLHMTHIYKYVYMKYL